MRFKNIFSVGTGIQILLLIGAIAVQEFSMKRMGMMRHIMFLNQEWEANLPLEAIKTTLIAIKEKGSDRNIIAFFCFIRLNC